MSVNYEFSMNFLRKSHSPCVDNQMEETCSWRSL